MLPSIARTRQSPVEAHCGRLTRCHDNSHTRAPTSPVKAVSDALRATPDRFQAQAATRAHTQAHAQAAKPRLTVALYAFIVIVFHRTKHRIIMRKVVSCSCVVSAGLLLVITYFNQKALVLWQAPIISVRALLPFASHVLSICFVLQRACRQNCLPNQRQAHNLACSRVRVCALRPLPVFGLHYMFQR